MHPFNFTIPVLNLSDFYSEDEEVREQFIQDVGNALSEVGFLSLVNHGVETDYIEKAYSYAQKFFELPEEVKLKYDINNKGQRGFTGFGKETAKGNGHADLKAFYHIGQELPEEHYLNAFYPRNVWPSEVGFESFKDVMLKLYNQLEGVASDVLRASAMYLDEKDSLLSDMVHNGNSILRLLHYPKVEEGKLPGSIRAAAHEDINFITLLCESTAPGLELFQSDETWLPIHRLNGQIIVNSSDMLKNISNGVFRSTTHRVVNPEPEKNEARFSLPFFVHPRSEVNLSPLKSCIERVGEQRTRNITAGDFLQERLKELKL